MPIDDEGRVYKEFYLGAMGPFTVYPDEPIVGDDDLQLTDADGNLMTQRALYSEAPVRVMSTPGYASDVLRQSDMSSGMVSEIVLGEAGVKKWRFRASGGALITEKWIGSQWVQKQKLT